MRSEAPVQEKAARLTWRDVFTPREGTEPLTADEQAAIDAYLCQFMNPPRNDDGKAICPGCRKAKRLEWGIANGEAHCVSCGYPYRVYHRDVGPVEFFSSALPYHPDDISHG